MHNKSSTPCVNLSVVDDDLPENEDFITLGLAVGPDDKLDVSILQDRQEVIVSILDDDHGTLRWINNHWRLV
jgi:hypothetical protein